MTRVVLDTNVLVSALLNPNGPPAEVLLFLLTDPEYSICLSAEIYREYDEVLRRPRFMRKAEEIEPLLRTLRDQAIWVKPGDRLRICLDPDDNMFLECAFAAGAHCLVTGNARHFPAAWMKTRVMSPRSFLEVQGL